MTKNTLIFIILSLFTASLSASKKDLCVLKKGDELFVGVKQDDGRDLLIHFKHCMYNNLMTFYKVGYAENLTDRALENPDREITQIFNHSFSDNIGPMNVVGQSWLGGNHSYQERGKTRTARTETYSILVDDKELQDDKALFGSKLELRVENTILYAPVFIAENDDQPIELPEILATEFVTYTMEGSNILVSVTHKFYNENEITIHRYYGAQSMAQGKELYFVNGHTQDFVPKGTDMEALKKDYPNFNKYVQKDIKKSAYESVYLLDSGLGNHQMIGDSVAIYIASSFNKVYHYLVNNQVYKKGDSHHWTALYSWFQPFVDDENVLVYQAKMKGRNIVFIDVKKNYEGEVKLPTKLTSRKYKVIEQSEGLTIVNPKLREFKLRGKGSLILQF